jgi:predicted HTH transcriptional regulator
MKEKEIEILIDLDETSKVDFKKEWYKSTDKNNHEIIKDFVALANGNSHSVGNPAYLICGVKEIKYETNTLHYVILSEDISTTKKQILQNLKNYLEPPITDFEIQLFTIKNKKILAIKIPYQGYLIKLKKKIT